GGHVAGRGAGNRRRAITQCMLKDQRGRPVLVGAAGPARLILEPELSDLDGLTEALGLYKRCSPHVKGASDRTLPERPAVAVAPHAFMGVRDRRCQVRCDGRSYCLSLVRHSFKPPFTPGRWCRQPSRRNPSLTAHRPVLSFIGPSPAPELTLGPPLDAQ